MCIEFLKEQFSKPISLEDYLNLIFPVIWLPEGKNRYSGTALFKLTGDACVGGPVRRKPNHESYFPGSAPRSCNSCSEAISRASRKKSSPKTKKD